MRQIFVIHGGTTFDTKEEFIAFLKKKPVELKHLKPGRDWKGTMQEALGDGCDVYQPQMPNKQDAKYTEWKVWFERLLPLMEDDVILIGHSLGGLFLAKFLSEETFPKRIGAVFLIAAPYDLDTESSESLADFALPESLSKLAEQSKIIQLYHSTDDAVVPMSNLSRYQQALPYARASIFGDRGHFNQEAFPEIVADIKSLG